MEGNAIGYLVDRLVAVALPRLSQKEKGILEEGNTGCASKPTAALRIFCGSEFGHTAARSADSRASIVFIKIDLVDLVDLIY